MRPSNKNTFFRLLIASITALSLVTGCSSISNKNSDSSTPGNETEAQDDTSEEQPTQSDESDNVLLNEIMSLATEGKVIKSYFKVKTNVIEDVEKEWGTPEKSEWIPAAKGLYSTYPSKNVDLDLIKALNFLK